MSIFCIKDLSGLPESLINDLSKKRGRKPDKQKNLVRLFEVAGRPLTLNEIAVGYYRMYKKEWPVKNLKAMMYHLCKTKRDMFEKDGCGLFIMKATKGEPK